MNDIAEKLTSDLTAIKMWLNAHKLFMNSDKTTIMLIGTGNVQYNNFTITIDDHKLKQVIHTKCLGVIVDDELRFQRQVIKSY